MGWLHFRIEFHVVSPADPGVAGITQQIVHFILFALDQPELSIGT